MENKSILEIYGFRLTGWPATIGVIVLWLVPAAVVLLVFLTRH
jgi:hypothetical protein